MCVQLFIQAQADFLDKLYPCAKLCTGFEGLEEGILLSSNNLTFEAEYTGKGVSAAKRMQPIQDEIAASSYESKREARSCFSTHDQKVGHVNACIPRPPNTALQCKVSNGILLKCETCGRT